MKTLTEWEESGLDLDKFLQVDDEIDYEIFEHIGYGLVGPNFDDGHWLQCGEAWSSDEDGVLTYETCEELDGRYFYRGIKRDMNYKKPKPKKKPVTSSPLFELKVGDKVKVMDMGLLMLMSYMPRGSKPMNEGVVHEILDDGKTILVQFPIGDDNPDEHSQVAPYPRNLIVKI